MKVNYTDLLLEAGRLFHQAKSNKELFEIIVEYTNSALQPALSCFYLNQKSDNSLKLTIKKGFAAVPKILMEQSELVSFLQESEEIICLNTRKPSPFADLLLSDTMESGLAVPLILGEKGNGVLIVNSKRPFFFKSREILFLENIRRLK
ncbi:MAG: GAF domain-containing protein [Spirochaetales bacterium]|nr:GAF domain-containing protein [Spirochaetales bacterium]